MRWWSGGRSERGPAVVFLPGLGAPGYLGPWAATTATRTCASVLDLPGWRWGRARSCAPTLDGVAGAVADWIDAHADGPVVLVGHSTGAQAVARTARARPDLVAGLVLAGPTFDPGVRRPRQVVRAALTTLPRERPAELPAVLPSYLHSGGRPLLRFLGDALADRPERTVVDVAAPVLVLTGRHDGFAPPAWAAALAHAAGAPHVVSPGAHNCCFPHPRIADAVLEQWVRRAVPQKSDDAG